MDGLACTLTGEPCSALAPAWRAMDDRLCRDRPEPLLVAFSGGGDSLALLLIARAWAGKVGRPLIAASFDHRLQHASTDWIRWCAERCTSLGVPHLGLTWGAPKPGPGVASAARLARHRSLADAARSVGASVTLFGHTADDVMEAALMRAEGSTTPSPVPWGPSPVWPEGRGVFILRPLLSVRRAALRTSLQALGETWIEDPANSDLASPRARARRRLNDGASSPENPGARRALAPSASSGPAGELRLPLQAVLDANPTDARRWVAAAILCAAGRQTPPRTRSIDRLLERLRRQDGGRAALAGVMIMAEGADICFTRDTGLRRGDAATIATLKAGDTGVWDGRFEVLAAQDVTLGHLSGKARRLQASAVRILHRLPPAVRPAIPAATTSADQISLPTLGDEVAASMRGLVQARFAAATGKIHHESAMVPWRSVSGAPSFRGVCNEAGR